ncbi:putative membrane-associated protein [Frankia sp. QA3]|nr:putative membrane-associated protein [Frankia sp. QA3]
MQATDPIISPDPVAGGPPGGLVEAGQADGSGGVEPGDGSQKAAPTGRLTEPGDGSAQAEPTGRAGRLAHQLWPALLTGSLLGLGALGLALVPALAGRAPLLLIALRPTWAILLLVGGSVPFVPALLVAAFFRGLVDVGYFGLARNNIRSVLLRRLGGSRLVTALTRPGTQTPLLWFCLVNTNAAVDAALGAGGVPMRRFLQFLIPGSLLSAALYLTAARAVAPWMRGAVNWLDAHMTYLVLGGLALALAQAAGRVGLRRWRSRRGRPPAGRHRGNGDNRP